VNLGACATSTGPHGAGRVRITFATDGTARAVVIDGPPFAGTTAGSCIMQRFRAVHVPPFSGADVTVGKSFVLQ